MPHNTNNKKGCQNTTLLKEVRRPVNSLVLKPWTFLRYLMSKYEPSELATTIITRFDYMTYSKIAMYLPDTS